MLNVYQYEEQQHHPCSVERSIEEKRIRTRRGIIYIENPPIISREENDNRNRIAHHSLLTTRSAGIPWWISSSIIPFTRTQSMRWIVEWNISYRVAKLVRCSFDLLLPSGRNRRHRTLEYVTSHEKIVSTVTLTTCHFLSIILGNLHNRSINRSKGACSRRKGPRAHKFLRCWKDELDMSNSIRYTKVLKFVHPGLSTGEKRPSALTRPALTTLYDLPNIIESMKKDQLHRRMIDRSIHQDSLYSRLTYADRKPE